jgi:hypothetical protein
VASARSRLWHCGTRKASPAQKPRLGSGGRGRSCDGSCSCPSASPCCMCPAASAAPPHPRSETPPPIPFTRPWAISCVANPRPLPPLQVRVVRQRDHAAPSGRLRPLPGHGMRLSSFFHNQKDIGCSQFSSALVLRFGYPRLISFCLGCSTDPCGARFVRFGRRRTAACGVSGARTAVPCVAGEENPLTSKPGSMRTRTRRRQRGGKRRRRPPHE